MKIINYVKVAKSQKNPIKFLISRILIRTKLCKFFVIKLKNYNLRFYPIPFLGSLWINPNYSHTADIFFGDYLKVGDKVIDTGANVGAVTLEASRQIGSTGKIYSIEPHPQIYKYLIGNIELNNFKNIKTFNIALGKENGVAFLSDIKSDDQNSIVSNNNGIEVELKRLDDLDINEEFFDLIILDAIGYEKFILEGGKIILGKTKCVHFPALEKFFKNFGYTFTDIIEIFIKSGFRIYRFTEDGIISPITEKYVPKEDLQITDLLAIRDLSDFMKRTNYSLDKN